MGNLSDPLSWAVPAGRLFGVRIRISLLFLAVLFFELLDAHRGGPDFFRFVAVTLAILWLSVLLHEFGHCFAARAVGGSAEEILMWPLGGLAMVSHPHTPRAEAITVACGPLVNLALCVITGVTLALFGYVPPNPFGADPLRIDFDTWNSWPNWLAAAFAMNLMGLLFNLVPAFPMDGGRLLRSFLWSRSDFVNATMVTVVVAKFAAGMMFVVALLLIKHQDMHVSSRELILVGVAVFVFLRSEQERQMLEAGMIADESVFGYDFSQGYTSLSASAPKPRARRPGFFERWRRKREQRRSQRELVERREEERKLDELLDKIARLGQDSLTEQEARFLTRVSKKYRNRNRQE